MRKCAYALASATVALCSTGALAEQATVVTPVAAPQPAVAAPAPAPAAIIVGSDNPNILRSGTKVALRTLEPLTTKGKKLRVGERFQMEVAEPVELNGVVVIPVGSPAVGEVTDVRNKGMWGKSGRINARALSVRANGRQIRLTGQMDDKGVTGTAGVVASIALIPVAGFFTTGTSANIPIGSPLNAFLDEDLTIAFAQTAPAPMVVPAPVPIAAPVPAAAPAPVTPVAATPAPALIPAVAVTQSPKG